MQATRPTDDDLARLGQDQLAFYVSTYEQAIRDAESRDEIGGRAAENEISMSTISASISLEDALRAVEEQRREYEDAELQLLIATGEPLEPLPDEVSPPPPRQQGWAELLGAFFAGLFGREPDADRLSASSEATSSRMGATGIATAEAARRSARARLVDALREVGVFRPLRAKLESAIADSYSLELDIGPDDAPGLAEVIDEDYVVSTNAEAQLEKLVKRMPGGSIGISGPRGAGKTTLIRAFCRLPNRRSDRPLVATVVSAPTRYDGREFVLHLFASVCESVLGGPRARDERRRRRALDVARPSLGLTRGQFVSAATGFLATTGLLLVLAALTSVRLEPAVIAGGALVALAGALLMISRVVLVGLDPGMFSHRRSTLRVRALVALPAFLCGSATIAFAMADPIKEPLFNWGVVALVLALLVSAMGRRPLRPAVFTRSRSALSPDIIELAETRLDDIEFQQTITSGWAGAIKARVGIEASRTSSLALAEVPLAFPQIAALFRAFLQDIAGERETSADVFIGIDELDKMESEIEAHRFLNDVKGIFGVKACFFLVSVSEEAMSAFERRGARLRDVFDSSFDEIVHVMPLEFEESRALLAERVSGLPIPYHALCFSLAAGLPRDLLRVARTLVSLKPSASTGQIGDIAEGVIRIELAARVRAVIVAARNIETEPDAHEFIEWARRVEREFDGSASLLARCGSLESFAQGPPNDLDREDPRHDELHTLAALTAELVAFCYFAATVLECFTDDLQPATVVKMRKDPHSAGSFEALALARQTLAINVRAGWRTVTAFRTAHRMSPLAFPTALSRSQPESRLAGATTSRMES
jgi:hypothetical protein